MVPLSKYQDNPAPASAKAGASPSRSLGRNWGRIEEYLERRTIRKENEKINLFLSNRGPEMGSTFLVCFYDLEKDLTYVTGKTYPLVEQEENLVRISDCRTHFVRLDNAETVLILGCHDLNAYNQRNLKNTRFWRVFIKDEFRFWTDKYTPKYILHHPHSTVKVNTWRNGWSFINSTFPFVKGYVGSGLYYDPKRLRNEYDEMSKVLASNCKGDCIDFFVT